MKISELTRRDIFDSLRGVDIYGRLEETEFLSRLYDLEKLPSSDSRFKDAAGDIWQHRVNNYDWQDGWVFDDWRFNLRDGDDEILLRFLAEIVHPVVRPNILESTQLVQQLNQHLENDGFQLVEATRLSGKPVYVGKYIGVHTVPGLNAARELLSGTDASYVAQQITRIEAAVTHDPSLAIGTAKELVETCCKTILTERQVAFTKSAEIPELVKLTAKSLELTPDDIPDKAKAAETIKRLLSNLGSTTQGLAELRNQYGTGHGKPAGAKGLTARHAKLAAGAASTLAVFLVETHNERNTQRG
jgi:hypothetical protein